MFTGVPADDRDRSTFLSPAPSPRRNTKQKRGRRQQYYDGYSPQTPSPTPSNRRQQSRTPDNSRSQSPNSSRSSSPTSTRSLSPLPMSTGTTSPQQPRATSPRSKSSTQMFRVPDVLPLSNTLNTCYAVAVVQALHRLGLGPHLNAESNLSPLQLNLLNTLVPILSIRPTQNTPRSNLTHLVNSLNLCLPPENMFAIGRQQCAGEFLDQLLANLTNTRFISVFKETALCPFCGTSQTANLPTTQCDSIFLLALRHNNQPIDLSTAVAENMNELQMNLSCQTSNCVGYLGQLPSQIECSQEQVTIYWIGRNIDAEKCLTPISLPSASHLWPGKECVMVLAHCGRRLATGHWILFQYDGANWWRVDTALAAPVIENPFDNQLKQGQGNYTIDIFFFK